MGKKKPAKQDNERIILAIENPSVDFEKYGFVFTLRVPPLTEEAKLSLRSFSIMKDILTEDDLRDYKIPQLSVDEEAIEKDKDASPKIITEYVMPDLTNPRHQELVFGMLPQSQQNLLSNIAYLDIAVESITKNGKPITVQIGDKLHDVNTFLDFVKYVGMAHPGIRLLDLVDSLAREFLYWRENLDVSPVDLKN